MAGNVEQAVIALPALTCQHQRERRMSSKYLSNLASQCQGLARNLSYNDGDLIGSVKHTLIEASQALDHNAVSVHKTSNGIFVMNARGKSRFITVRERVAIWLLRGKTEIRP